jgi:hypothetical protein
MPNKGYNVALRLYGSLEPWFNKSWKPGDPELVSAGTNGTKTPSLRIHEQTNKH